MALTDPLPRAEFYGQDVWGTPWGAGHRGMDIERAATRPVPTLFGEPIVRRDSNSELGEFSVGDRGVGVRGRFIGYGHCVHGHGAGTVAGFGDNHGSKWSAPHVHLTVSDSIDGIDNRNRVTYDPEPFIIEAITGSSSLDVRPFPTDPEHLEEDTMHITSCLENGTLVQKDVAYTWDATGPIRALGQAEANFMMSAKPYGLGLAPLQISGWRLDLLAASRGILEVTWEGLQPTETGRIIKTRGDKITAEFPQVAGQPGAGGVTDPSILAAIAELDAKVDYRSNGLEKILAAVNANIDDQPTTFTATFAPSAGL